MKKLIAILILLCSLVAPAWAQGTYPGTPGHGQILGNYTSAPAPAAPVNWLAAGTSCPSWLTPYELFANTTGAPTSILLTVWDGTACAAMGVIDSTTHTFVPVGGVPGTGTVTGPISSIVGDVALWNNTGGSVLRDGGAYPFIGSTPNVSAINPASVGFPNQQPNGAAPVWNRMGPGGTTGVVIPSAGNCISGAGQVVQEHAILSDGQGNAIMEAPVILTQYPLVFKALIHGGNMRYAESVDLLSWTCSSSTINFTGATGAVVPHNWSKVGGTYIGYWVATAGFGVHRYTAMTANGTYTDTGNVFPLPSWSSSADNTFAMLNNSAHWILFTGVTPNSGPYTGFYSMVTADCGTAGTTCTASQGSPVLVGPSGFYVWQDSSNTYWLWSHSSQGANTSGLPPNDIYRWHSTTPGSLTAFTADNSGNCTLCRETFVEGAGVVPGSNGESQIADPNMVQFGGRTYMFYESNFDQTFTDVVPTIDLVIANMPFSQLVTTEEGAAPVLNDTSTLPSSKNYFTAGPGNPVVVGNGVLGEYFSLQQCGTISYIAENLYCNASNALALTNAASGGAYISMQNASDLPSINLAIVDPEGSVNTVLASQLINAASPGNGTYNQIGGPLCLGGAVNACGSSAPIFWWSAGHFGFGVTTDTDQSQSLYFAGARQVEEAAPTATSGFSNIWDDSTAHRVKFNYNGGSNFTLPAIVAQSTSALGTSSISAGACASVVTTAATGALTTDTISWAFNAQPTAVNWGSLTVQAYPSAGNVNFQVCNPSAGSITPTAITLNWTVIR